MYIDVEPTRSPGVGGEADGRAVTRESPERVDGLRRFGQVAPRVARRLGVQQLAVLVAADVRADDQLTGLRTRVNCLHPIGRRHEQLRPTFLWYCPGLGHAAQIGDKY